MTSNSYAVMKKKHLPSPKRGRRFLLGWGKTAAGCETAGNV